ncbi:MAG: hypothetical protein IAE98_03155 [Candidatus Kapabacteria bacterium]|nr:hypothetical protein [Candidatus Kapabacteria bacterium]
MTTEYNWNEHGVCTNYSTLYFRPRKRESFELNYAVIDGKYYVGYNVQVNDSGSMSPCSKNGESFDFLMDGIKDTIKRVKRKSIKFHRLVKAFEYDKTIRAEIDLICNIQMNLF